MNVIVVKGKMKLMALKLFTRKFLNAPEYHIDLYHLGRILRLKLPGKKYHKAMTIDGGYVFGG